jgi:hypothetical protein
MKVSVSPLQVGLDIDIMLFYIEDCGFHIGKFIRIINEDLKTFTV